MKRIITAFTAVLIVATMWAQSPEAISYQAVIRNFNNELVANTSVGVQLSILQASISGTPVYVERQFPTTNSNGLVSIEIGTGTILSGNFSNIDWANGPYFIKTETDLNGGANYTISGTSQLLSVPYALYAKTAESITGSVTEIDPIFVASPSNGITYSNIDNWNGKLSTETDPLYTSSQASNITATDIANLSNLSGSNTGDQDISGIAVNTIEVSTNTLNISSNTAAIALNTNKDTTGIYHTNRAALDIVSGTNTGDQNISGIGANANAITTIQGEQTNQNAAIAINTAKVGLTTSQVTVLENTSGTNTGDQALADVIAVNNSANAQIKNLTNPTDAQDAATKAYVDELLAQIEELQIATGIKVIDYEGNVYPTVLIGEQIWMAENLRVIHYPNGNTIPFVTENITWGNLGDNNTDDAFCYYDNIAASQYGALYSWSAAMGDNAVSSSSNPSDVQGVCPDGWHLPSDAEWTELERYLGENGNNYDGTSWNGTENDVDARSKIAKSLATDNGWIPSINIGAVGNTDYPAFRNISGFFGLPGGYRNCVSGTSYSAEYHGFWWSSTEQNSDFAYYRPLDYANANAYRDDANKSYGYSVRCVKD